MNSRHTSRMILMGLFVALSFLGSNIKIFSTVAFDSFPAYFAGLFLGGVAGGVVGYLGHLMTSGLSGFPFGLPIHLVISVMMFVAVLLFSGVSKKTNPVLGGIVAVIINGVVMPVVLVLMPGFEWAMAMAFMPMLIGVSAANVFLAVAVHVAVSKTGILSGSKNAGL